MNAQLFVLTALIGWCGTTWPPRRWPWPAPQPDPNPWISKVVGVAGGIIGGWAISAIAGTIVTDGFVATAIGPE